MLTVEKIAEQEIKKMLKCNALCIPCDKNNDYADTLIRLIATPEELKNCSFATDYASFDHYSTMYTDNEGNMYDIINRETNMSISKVTWTRNKPIQAKLMDYGGDYNGKVYVMSNEMYLPMQAGDIENIKECNKPVTYGNIRMLTIFGINNQFEPKSVLELMVSTKTSTVSGYKHAYYRKVLLGEEINKELADGNKLYKQMIDEINNKEKLDAGLTLDDNNIITRVVINWEQ